MAAAPPDAQRLAEENGRTLEALLARLQSLNKKIAEVPSAAHSAREARLAAADYEQVIEEIYKQQSELIVHSMHIQSRKQREHAAREEELKRLLGTERAFSTQLRNQLIGLQASHRSLLSVLKLHLGQGDNETYEKQVRELARTDPTLCAIVSQLETEA